MNWDAVGALAEALGAIAVIVSLIYVAMQVRQGTQQSRMNAQSELVRELGNISQAVAADSDLADIVFEGSESPESLSPVEQMRFRSFLNHLFTLFEQQFLFRREGAVNDETWVPVDTMVSDFLAEPGVRWWWSGRSSYHTEAFQRYVAQKLGDLDEKPSPA